MAKRVSHVWRDRNISPRGLIIGTNLSYSEHCRCPFGAYVQTHEEGYNKTDTERSLDAICLGPTGNSQGTYNFMNLATGMKIKRRKWTELPVSDWVIKRVNDLGKKDKNEKELTFRNRSKQIVDDDTSETDGFDDDIIAPDITDEARDEHIDEGVSRKTNHIDNQLDDNADRDENATRSRILTDEAAQRNRTSLEITRAHTLEQGVPRYDEEQNDNFTETTEISSPPLEQQEPGNVRTEATRPRIKFESETNNITNQDA